MKRAVKNIWMVNFSVALVVLLLIKLMLIGNNIFGTEGYESPGKLLGKSLLFFGGDIFGAAFWAGIVALICLPLLRWERAWKGVSALLQAAHAFFCITSSFTAMFIGSHIDRATLDLAFLDQPMSASGGSSLDSSIARYLNFWTVSGWILVCGLAIAGIWLAPVILRRLKARTKLVVGSVLGVEMLVTMAILPFLINGEVAGIRVHTFGLERSSFTILASSYVKPVWQKLTRPSRAIPDPFMFDLASRERPGPVEDNPVAKAIAQKTSIVWVSLESVGSLYLDEDPPPMPFMQSIGVSRDGVSFAMHLSSWPQTMKAFFALFCSELCHPDYKSISFINPAIPCRSISQVLHDAGYYTALITSADLAYDRKMRFFQHRDLDLTLDMRNMPGREDVWKDSWGLDERLSVKAILDLAREKQDTPFFVFYEMAVAHHPYLGCQEHIDDPISDERLAYRRALGFIDDRIRELVEGLPPETLVVIVSDHAEGFGQHPGSRSHGPKVYQENVWVPWVVTGPQLQGIRGQVSATTSHLDVSPTVLGLVGLDVPCTMKGRNFVAAEVPEQIAIFSGRPPGMQAGLVDGSWKTLVDEDGVEELYNLAEDPHELHNLVDEFPERVQVARERLEDWRYFSRNLIENYGAILLESQCRP